MCKEKNREAKESKHNKLLYTIICICHTDIFTVTILFKIIYIFIVIKILNRNTLLIIY